MNKEKEILKLFNIFKKMLSFSVIAFSFSLIFMLFAIAFKKGEFFFVFLVSALLWHFWCNYLQSRLNHITIKNNRFIFERLIKEKKK